MRVTMLVRCLAMMRGGGETRHLAWARELRSLGVEVDFLAGRPLLFGGPRYAVDDPNVRLLRSPYARDFVYRHQRQRGFGRLTAATLHADEEWFCRAAWRAIAARAQRPDVVHAHALHQAARLRVAGTAVVINLPGEPHARYRDDLRQADALVGDGWAAEHLPDRLGVPVERVSKGVDAERFSPEGRDLRESLRLRQRKVVATVARLVPIKNVRLLVDAIAIVRERILDVHLLIVGDGPERTAIRERVGELGLTDCVTFVGHVPHRETPECYRTADVFALSSDFDNSPNVVLEAMACGLPVVATDAGGAREFLGPGGGLIVPRGDGAALAKALERYLADPIESRLAGAQNRRTAAAQFSWPVSAHQLLAVYERVVEARRQHLRASA
jgi:glycosyltransferase involved in cell wall biosynthesis